MAKVICKNCPCMKSDDYGISCNLGFDTHWNKEEGEYIADSCELKSISTARFTFRPTKRAVDLLDSSVNLASLAQPANH